MTIHERTGQSPALIVAIAARSCHQSLGECRWQLSPFIRRSVPQAVGYPQRTGAISGRDRVFGVRSDE